MIQTAIKWHGGKAYLASKIRALFPPHVHYVEPYAGGLSVLLAGDGEGVSEVVSDLHYGLTLFWRVLQQPELFSKFQRVIEAMPFSESEFDLALAQPGSRKDSDDYRVERAVKFFIRCRQSLAGRMKAFAPLSRSRTRRGMNEQAAAWITAVDGLPEIHARLRRVVILNRPAIEVIRQQDGPDTLFYLDPPYLHETRTTTKEYGELEMTAEQHGEMLAALSIIKGKFCLSGYESGMYQRCAALNGWRCRRFTLPNNAASGKTKRVMTECVWCNFDLPTESARSSRRRRKAVESA